MALNSFPAPLIKGKLLKRYKRFLADVELADGTVITAHCANTGSMKGLLADKAFVGLSPNTNPKAKLHYRWELVKAENCWVGIQTGRANPIVESLIANGAIQPLAAYDAIKREVKYGQNSRVDLLLSAKDRPDCYVEVKSVTLKEGNQAKFPDSVSTRGTKHLNELIDMVSRGHRAAMLYLVQRDDCQCFDVARDIDPAYGKAFDAAIAEGVEIYVHQIQWSLKGWVDAGPLPLAVKAG